MTEKGRNMTDVNYEKWSSISLAMDRGKLLGEHEGTILVEPVSKYTTLTYEEFIATLCRYLGKYYGDMFINTGDRTFELSSDAIAAREAMAIPEDESMYFINKNAGFLKFKGGLVITNKGIHILSKKNGKEFIPNEAFNRSMVEEIPPRFGLKFNGTPVQLNFGVGDDKIPVFFLFYNLIDFVLMKQGEDI